MFFIKLDTREVHVAGVTSTPNEQWMKQIARNLTMDPSLKIVIVDENPVRAAILMDGLREAGFTQVLRLDEKNVYTLANLAAIQLERGNLSEAEKHINRAIELEPDGVC